MFNILLKFWNSTKSSKTPCTSKPPVSKTETGVILTANTSSYRGKQSKKNVKVFHVEIRKDTIPALDTFCYRANKSKKNVNEAHLEPETEAFPSVNTSSYRANQNKKTVNLVHVEKVNNGTISIGNKTVTNYLTTDYNGYGASTLEPRKRILQSISEELKSSTLPLSVDNKYYIADHIGSNWKRMARLLPDADFSDGQLENLQCGSENQTELVVNILNRWYEVSPYKATVGNLAKTLEKIQLNDLAVGLEPSDCLRVNDLAVGLEPSDCLRVNDCLSHF